MSSSSVSRVRMAGTVAVTMVESVQDGHARRPQPHRSPTARSPTPGCRGRSSPTTSSRAESRAALRPRVRVPDRAHRDGLEHGDVPRHPVPPLRRRPRPRRPRPGARRRACPASSSTRPARRRSVPTCSPGSTSPGAPCWSAPGGTATGAPMPTATRPTRSSASTPPSCSPPPAPPLVGIDSVNIDDTRDGDPADPHRPARRRHPDRRAPVPPRPARRSPFTFFAVPPAVVGMGTFPVRAFALVP